METTPLIYSKRLSKKYGAKIYLKREDLQPVRSYKIR
ncbi:pyridoxal-phosphate dependent enzyme [bacterium]|nr:pyridoxal-phosphate dependent enzyme [bacterium]